VFVGKFDAEDASPLHDLFSFPRRKIVGNLSRESSIVHQKQLQISRILDQERFEAVGSEISSFLGGSVTNFGHRNLSLESSSHARVNTLRLSP